MAKEIQVEMNELINKRERDEIQLNKLLTTFSYYLQEDSYIDARLGNKWMLAKIARINGREIIIKYETHNKIRREVN